MASYGGNPQYSWYSRVDNTQAGKCGVVTSSGQVCGDPAGSTGMCYSHEAEVRAEVTKASTTQTSTNYSYSNGYGYGTCSSSYGVYGYGYN